MGPLRLFAKNGRKDSLVFEAVRVVDPGEGIDETLTVAVERGVITRIEPAAGGNGKVLAPAFVDPHVHLRTPGREDEEDLVSGTRAAAARQRASPPRGRRRRPTSAGRTRRCARPPPTKK